MLVADKAMLSARMVLEGLELEENTRIANAGPGNKLWIDRFEVCERSSRSKWHTVLYSLRGTFLQTIETPLHLDFASTYYPFLFPILRLPWTGHVVNQLGRIWCAVWCAVRTTFVGFDIRDDHQWSWLARHSLALQWHSVWLRKARRMAAYFDLFDELVQANCVRMCERCCWKVVSWFTHVCLSQLYQASLKIVRTPFPLTHINLQSDTYTAFNCKIKMISHYDTSFSSLTLPQISPPLRSSYVNIQGVIFTSSAESDCLDFTPTHLYSMAFHWDLSSFRFCSLSCLSITYTYQFWTE